MVWLEPCILLDAYEMKLPRMLCLFRRWYISENNGGGYDIHDSPHKSFCCERYVLYCVYVGYGNKFHPIGWDFQTSLSSKSIHPCCFVTLRCYFDALLGMVMLLDLSNRHASQLSVRSLLRLLWVVIAWRIGARNVNGMVIFRVKRMLMVSRKGEKILLCQFF